MSKIRCWWFGHKWRRGSLKSLKHGIIESDMFMCLRCHKKKEAPATFYRPMDMPPPPTNQSNKDKSL